MESSLLFWAIDQLNKKGYQLNSLDPDIIQETAWSTVYRFETNHGFVFLKKMPPDLALEPKVIELLYKKFHASVPCIIATNENAHSFLMQDSGLPLHYYFKENFHADIFIHTIQDYINLQISATDKIDLFFKLGVPDWRLEQLVKLYHELLSDEELLINDGLKQNELIILKKLSAKLNAICEKLSTYQIKDTFSHADFHDKNILINPHTKQTTLIDLGEVVITHPFFSFLNCLHMAKENFSLPDSQYQEIVMKCFQPWLIMEKQKHLFEILNIIQQCWSIHAVLGDWRLIKSVNPVASQELRKQGRFATKLRFWINASDIG